MISGYHSHYCPRHKKEVKCAQVTHCSRAAEALCADCAYDDYVKQSCTDYANDQTKDETQESQ